MTVPPELEAVVQKLLEKDPKDRYQTVEEMVEEVALSLVGYDDRFDWKNWPSRWRGKVPDGT